jgi:CHAT domain-containing protein/tetratricopeptide (TPR) repeat protein
MVAKLISNLCVLFCSFNFLISQDLSWAELMDSTDFYSKKQDFKSAVQFAKLALPKAEIEFGQNNQNFAYTLLSVSNIFFLNLGNIDSAIYYGEKYLKIIRELFKSDHPTLATSIKFMATFYDARGYYKCAEPLFKEALEMSRRLYKYDNPNLASNLNSLGSFYYGRGDYKQAEPLYKEALEMYRHLFKGDDPGLARSINNMAVFYNRIGDYIHAESLYKEALEMYKRLYKGDHPNLAQNINNMAMFYIGRRNNKLAEPLLEEAIEMRRRIFKSDHPDLAESINNMAHLYHFRGDYKQSELLYKEALEMRRRIYKGDHPYLGNSINNMAVFCNAIGDYKQAEALYKEALEMYRRLFNGNNSLLANSINNMAVFYKDRGIFKKAEPLYLELMGVCFNLINNYFPSLSEKEKEQYFSTISQFYISFNNFLTLHYKESPKLLEKMFDNLLVTKGMLLSASNNVRSRIISSNDTSLIQLFSSWKDNKENIAKLFLLTNTELKNKNLNLDSIIQYVNEQERELTLRSDVFKNEYDKKKITWKDIQINLGKTEAVVEIVRINLIEKNRITDTIYYAALIVMKNSKMPELVLLKNGNALESDTLLDSYKEAMHSKGIGLVPDNLYKLFWEPIKKKLKGVTTVFISPDGVYNQLNLATLKNPKTGKYLLDENDIVLLSNTKNLLKKKSDVLLNTEENNVAELLGDPCYTLDSAKQQQLPSNFRSKNKVISQKSVIDRNTTRGGYGRLPGTKVEIDFIFTMLLNKRWDVRKHLGEEALEETVKSLNSPRLLHIATHGLFLEDVEHINKDERVFGMEMKRFAENPLLRSMLLFTGANNTIENKNLTNSLSSSDDGLLTAYEAMNLSLDNTELVVLSACETGLGKIKNGEGVYGLQRAFIQAGAKSLIMSLWSVDDEKTMELMKTFYKKWLAGKTKRRAFKEAQQVIKNKYKSPYYWGAFVMVGE